MNLVNALKLVKEQEAKITGVVGWDGGHTAQVADAVVIIPTQSPETVTPHAEAFQAVVWHLMVSHPDLKANERFRDLQTKLEGTENRINVARIRYNEAAKQLNTYSRQFLGSFFCKRAGVEPVEYFEATEQAKTEVPKVEF